jgi:hypothetical protein
MAECTICNHVNSSTSKYCAECGAALVNDPPNFYTDEPNEPPPSDKPADGDSLDGRILSLMREGKKIPAVKLCREQTGLGLKEAKDYVESLAKTHDVVAPAGSGCAGMLALVLVGLVASVVGFLQSV